MVDKNEKIITGVDHDGKEVKVLIKNPTAEQYRDSQIAYNKAFRTALDSGALLRQKINDYMVEQGIWSDAKQKKYESLVRDINNKEELLTAGGVKLSDAKQAALELRGLRAEFRDLIAERNNLDSNSAEGQADNARFAELVRMCMINPSTKQPYFPDQKTYDAQADQPWVTEASSELANMLYGLDPDYENNLVENKFLKEFKFVNEDLRFINDGGHLVDSESRLINEDGQYITYRTDEGLKNQDEDDRYFVNREGEEVISRTNEDGEEEWVKKSLAERKPFLDDDGNPIVVEVKEEPAETEEKPEETPEQNVESDKDKPKTTKRKPRATKTDTKTV